jgi:hypothetical protein
MFHYFSVKPIRSNPKLDKFLIATKKEFSDFFGVNVEQPNIFFLNSRKDINKIWNRKTESWQSGWAKNGNIFILNPKIYTKESDHTAKHFWQTIKHEYCHLYYKKLTGTSYPKWLNEGLACYLAGQVKKSPTLIDIMKVFDYFKRKDWQTYSIGYFWVKLLVEKFGKKKFLGLLKQLEPELSKNEFKSIFYKVYKIKFSEKCLISML